MVNTLFDTDHAHHAGKAKLALHELLAFDDAVKVGMDMTSIEDTLLVVTADHGHTMAMGGYSVRGNDILGKRLEQLVKKLKII